MRRAVAVCTVVAALVLSGCGADSERVETTGIDQLTIPTPSPDSDDFVGDVDNAYFPLPDDGEWAYDVDDGVQSGTTTVTVELSAPAISGVAVTGVRTSTLIGKGPVVDTVDYYAQDVDGNVWWFGRRGEWEAGQDGAEAGLAMPADPRVGDGWRRAFQDGVVEDRLTVMSVEGDEVVLRQESDLEPGAVVELTYARGFGLTSSLGPDGSTELTSGP